MCVYLCVSFVHFTWLLCIHYYVINFYNPIYLYHKNEHSTLQSLIFPHNFALKNFCFCRFIKWSHGIWSVYSFVGCVEKIVERGSVTGLHDLHPFNVIANKFPSNFSNIILLDRGAT